MRYRILTIAGSIVLFLILLLIVFSIYTLVNKDIVHVQSSSMENSSDDSIKKGDWIRLKRTKDRGDVTTFIEGRNSHYRKFGTYGDLIIFPPNGDESRTKIIHRAIVYIQWNSTGGGYDVPRLGIYNSSGSFIIEDFPYPEKRGLWIDLGNILDGFNQTLQGPHSGYLTKGDNNLIIDQNSQFGSELDWVRPVRSDYLHGIALYEIQQDPICCFSTCGLTIIIVILVFVALVLIVNDRDINRNNRNEGNSANFNNGETTIKNWRNIENKEPIIMNEGIRKERGISNLEVEEDFEVRVVPKKRWNRHFSFYTGGWSIATLIILAVSLFLFCIAPWALVEVTVDLDHNNNKETETNLVDFLGNKYIFSDHDVLSEDFWETRENLSAGRWQGLFGLLLGIAMTIALTALGFIPSKSDRALRAMCFARATVSIIATVPLILITLCGSKFIGYGLSVTNSGRDPNLWLPLFPVYLFIIGLILLLVNLSVIGNEILTLVKLRRERNLSDLRLPNGVPKGLVFLSLLIVVTLPLLPVVTGIVDQSKPDGGQAEVRYYYSTGVLFQSEDSFDNQITYKEYGLRGAIFYYRAFNFFSWLAFFISLCILFSYIFHVTGWSDLTGKILMVVGTQINFILVIMVLLHLLAILFTFSTDSSNSEWIYSYNYFPVITLIALCVGTVRYTISSIRDLVNHKRMETRPSNQIS